MYVLLLDEVERLVASERQVAAVLALRQEVQLPTYTEERRRFDEALLAEPAVVDQDRDDLLRALGVRP